jgi:hypothetical protein
MSESESVSTEPEDLVSPSEQAEALGSGPALPPPGTAIIEVTDIG